MASLRLHPHLRKLAMDRVKEGHVIINYYFVRVKEQAKEFEFVKEKSKKIITHSITHLCYNNWVIRWVIKC